MSQNLLTGLAVLAIAVFISACQATPNTPTPTPEQIEQSAATPDPTSDATQTSPDLMNMPAGSTVVSTTTTYQSPGGPEEVGFSLVVDNTGMIVDATTTVLGKSPTTTLRQESFAEAFPAAVEGQKLSDLGAIDRVGGSSLTTKAFNDALVDLQAQL